MWQISVWPNTFIYIAFYFCLGRRKYYFAALYRLRDRRHYFQFTATPCWRPWTHARVFVVILETKTCHSRFREFRRVLIALVLRKGLVSWNHPCKGLGWPSYQRLPNNISIKIDTTQEYVRDEVSFLLFWGRDLSLIRMNGSTHLQQNLKVHKRFSRFGLECHEDDEKLTKCTTLYIGRTLVSFFFASFLHWL